MMGIFTLASIALLLVLANVRTSDSYIILVISRSRVKNIFDYVLNPRKRSDIVHVVMNMSNTVCNAE